MKIKLLLKDNEKGDKIITVEAKNYKDSLNELWNMLEYWYSDSDIANMDSEDYEYVLTNHFQYSGKLLKWEHLELINDKFWLCNKHNQISEINENTYNVLWSLMDSDQGLEKIIHIYKGAESEVRKDLCIYEEVNNILTFSEACELWGLNESTLRKAVSQGRDGLKLGIDYRKSGKSWLITRSAMERIYGKLK